MTQTRNKPTHLGAIVTTRLSPLMQSILNNASQKTNVTKSELIRMALMDFFMGDYVTRIRKRVRLEGLPPGSKRKKFQKGGKAINELGCLSVIHALLIQGVVLHPKFLSCVSYEAT